MVIAWQSQFAQVKYNIPLRVKWNKMENKSKQGHNGTTMGLKSISCGLQTALLWASDCSASSWCHCDAELHLQQTPGPVQLLELGHRATAVTARFATVANTHCFKMLITFETFTISVEGELLCINSLYCTHNAGIEAAERMLFEFRLLNWILTLILGKS